MAAEAIVEVAIISASSWVLTRITDSSCRAPGLPNRLALRVERLQGRPLASGCRRGPAGPSLETVTGATDTDSDPQLLERRGLRGKRHVRTVSIRSIGHLNMVCLVPRHKLVPAGAIQNRVHHGPLRGRNPPSPVGFL